MTPPDPSTVAFVSAYPGVTLAVIGFLTVLVGSLLLFSVKTIVGQFKASVDKVDQILTKLFGKYEDLEHRLTTQETICKTCRTSCPERKTHASES